MDGTAQRAGPKCDLVTLVVFMSVPCLLVRLGEREI